MKAFSFFVRADDVCRLSGSESTYMFMQEEECCRIERSCQKVPTYDYI